MKKKQYRETSKPTSMLNLVDSWTRIHDANTLIVSVLRYLIVSCSCLSLYVPPEIGTPEFYNKVPDSTQGYEISELKCCCISPRNEDIFCWATS